MCGRPQTPPAQHSQVLELRSRGFGICCERLVTPQTYRRSIGAKYTPHTNLYCCVTMCAQVSDRLAMRCRPCTSDLRRGSRFETGSSIVARMLGLWGSFRISFPCFRVLNNDERHCRYFYRAHYTLVARCTHTIAGPTQKRLATVSQCTVHTLRQCCCCLNNGTRRILGLRCGAA